MCVVVRFGDLSVEFPQRWRTLPQGARHTAAWTFIAPTHAQHTHNEKEHREPAAAAAAGGAGAAGMGAGGVASELQGGGGGGSSVVSGDGDGAYDFVCDLSDAKIDVQKQGRYHYG